tara:strand:+ start:360 stop:668 length:309 start_codon:yes stop_codon:yes gene_type:complete
MTHWKAARMTGKLLRKSKRPRKIQIVPTDGGASMFGRNWEKNYLQSNEKIAQGLVLKMQVAGMITLSNWNDRLHWESRIKESLDRRAEALFDLFKVFEGQVL